MYLMNLEIKENNFKKYFGNNSPNQAKLIEPTGLFVFKLVLENAIQMVSIY